MNIEHQRKNTWQQFIDLPSVLLCSTNQTSLRNIQTGFQLLVDGDLFLDLLCWCGHSWKYVSSTPIFIFISTLNSHGGSICRESTRDCHEHYSLWENLRRSCLALTCLWSTAPCSTLTLDMVVFLGHSLACGSVLQLQKKGVRLTVNETTVALFHKTEKTDFYH